MRYGLATSLLTEDLPRLIRLTLRLKYLIAVYLLQDVSDKITARWNDNAPILLLPDRPQESSGAEIGWHPCFHNLGTSL